MFVIRKVFSVLSWSTHIIHTLRAELFEFWMQQRVLRLLNLPLDGNLNKFCGKE